MPLQGKLQESPVSDIIQLIQLSKQTGALLIRAEVRTGDNGQTREDSGRIYFQGGRVYYASLYDYPPDEAALQLFCYDQGDFVFNTGESAPPGIEPLQGSNEFLIMRGIERAEQTARNDEAFPADDIVPMITQSSSGGASLKSDEWRLLTFLNGQDDIATIARRSGMNMFRTKTVLRRLLDAGLISKVEKKTTNIPLFIELDQIAAANMQRSARQTLEASYNQISARADDALTYEQALQIAEIFRKRAGLLVGPGRANFIYEQMLERIRATFA